MKPHFHPALINDPLGDPGLVVHFLHESRALLFDLGDLSSVPNAVLLKVSHVFVSHTHIDHFIGFDRFLRIVFGRGKTIRMYGPENFIANVEGKLRGFTWNLVANYNESVTIEAVEVHEDHLLTARFRALDKFRKTGEGREPFAENVLLDEPAFSIHTAILEHRVPCLGFALKERFHVNIRKDRLDSLGLAPGAWLNELKRSIHEQRADDWPVRVPANGNAQNAFEERRLGDLKKDLVIISPGQKIAYVVDTVFNERNNRRIVDLVRDADVFYCESPFIAEEEERGRERCHLTSRQAGTLAKMAGVKNLLPFHFSARHSGRENQLRREAEEAFKA
ncbi:MAG: ribonuclease Z [Nitrospinae bacterium]|nr:ribonuclease Z [Nitrospinota bacterium]